MSDDKDYSQGVLYAVGAYVFWGIAPIYFKALKDVLPLEILAHRVVWSFVFLMLTISFTGEWKGIKALLKDRVSLLKLMLSAGLIGANWFIFIWAVGHDYLIDASLGYFINPLFNALLGYLFLGERIRPFQLLALVLCGLAVAIQILTFGSVPWIALLLATSFGLYGLMRKKMKVGAQGGLFVETVLLLPIAIAVLVCTPFGLVEPFANHNIGDQLLLLCAGIVTTIPLLLFAGAARRISLTLLGFLQYIGPSLMLIIAVAFYGEVLTFDKVLTFSFIWLALFLFSMSVIGQKKKKLIAESI